MVPPTGYIYSIFSLTFYLSKDFIDSNYVCIVAYSSKLIKENESNSSNLSNKSKIAFFAKLILFA